MLYIAHVCNTATDHKLLQQLAQQGGFKALTVCSCTHCLVQPYSALLITMSNFEHGYFVQAGFMAKSNDTYRAEKDLC